MDSAPARDRILAAARELFYAEGIRKVSVDAIARQAGVTKPTLYYHFKNKDGLISAYLDAQDEAIFRRFLAAAEDAPDTLHARVAALFKLIERGAARPGWQGCAMMRAAFEFAAVPQHRARTVPARHKSRLEDWLVGQIDRAGCPRPRATARAVMALLDGASAHVFLHRDPGYAVVAGRVARSVIEEACGPRKRRIAHG